MKNKAGWLINIVLPYHCMKHTRPEAGWHINVVLQYHCIKDTRPLAGWQINVVPQYHCMKDTQPQAGWLINVVPLYHCMKDTRPQAGWQINVVPQYHCIKDTRPQAGWLINPFLQYYFSLIFFSFVGLSLRVKTTTNYMALPNIYTLYFSKHFSFFLIMIPSNFFKNHSITPSQCNFPSPRYTFRLTFWVRKQVLKTVQASTSHILRVTIFMRRKAKTCTHNRPD